MQFLKILFWCLLAFVAALFTYGNWDTVPIKLWSGLIADTNLPLLLLVTFLLGIVPTTLYHHAVRWRLRQRIATYERMLAERPLPTPEPYRPIADPLPDPVVTPPPPAYSAAHPAPHPVVTHPVVTHAITPDVA